MTKQEMFDQVVDGLASQDFEQSIDSYGDCLYLSEDGKRCAAGHLFTDEELALIHPHFEGRTVLNLVNTEGLDLSRMDVTFAEILQFTHDHHNSATPEGMYGQFKELAHQWELDTLFLDIGWEEYCERFAVHGS